MVKFMTLLAFLARPAASIRFAHGGDAAEVVGTALGCFGTAFLSQDGSRANREKLVSQGHGCIQKFLGTLGAAFGEGSRGEDGLGFGDQVAEGSEVGPCTGLGHGPNTSSRSAREASDCCLAVT